MNLAKSLKIERVVDAGTKSLNKLGGCLRLRLACLPSSLHSKIQQYCGPNGPTASIFYGIWIKQSGAMIFIFNLDKVLLKKLFSTMNI